MAVSTIAFCHGCKWRSSIHPGTVSAAGAACPSCGSGISTLHFDPAFTTTIDGKPYNEMAAAAAHLAHHGISTVGPATTVPIPAHATIAPASIAVVPSTVS